jgi:hypothetical protein
MIVWGDWDKETVRLDFDFTPLGEVKLWAYRVCFWFKLEGFIILRSRIKEYIMKKKGKVVYRYLKCSYLVIFNRPVRWETNVKTMTWASLESGNKNLQRYTCMQCIKQTSSARISCKDKKPIPRVVLRFGKQNRQLRNSLKLENLFWIL